MGLKSVILQNKDKFIEYARNIKPEGRVLITDVEKEIAKSKKRCEDIDNSISKLFEQNLTQRIPAESYKILLERYKRERAALDSQLITLERRRKSERAQIYSAVVILILSLIIINARMLKSLDGSLSTRNERVNELQKTYERVSDDYSDAMSDEAIDAWAKKNGMQKAA